MRPRSNRGTDEPSGDDTFDFEFGAADLSSVPERAATACADRSLPARRWTSRTVGAFGITVALVLVGAIAYRSAQPRESEPRKAERALVASLSPPAAPAPAPQQPPIRYKNPFDHSEVFEFPAGTSRSQARELVQALLLQRARERQSQWGVAKRRSKQRPSGASYS